VACSRRSTDPEEFTLGEPYACAPVRDPASSSARLGHDRYQATLCISGSGSTAAYILSGMKFLCSPRVKNLEEFVLKIWDGREGD
jgi:hypothetical protein